MKQIAKKNEIFMNNFYCFVAYQILIFVDFPLSVFIEHNVCSISSYHPDIRCILISSTIFPGINTNSHQTNEALSVFMQFQYKPPLSLYQPCLCNQSCTQKTTAQQPLSGRRAVVWLSQIVPFFCLLEFFHSFIQLPLQLPLSLHPSRSSSLCIFWWCLRWYRKYHF